MGFCFNGLPRFIFLYPFSPLMVARIYGIITTILSLLIWRNLLENLREDDFYMWTAIADLLSLLFLLISSWFMVQKFFWIKIDASLSLLSVLFTLLGYIFCWNITRTDSTRVELRFLSICHFYLLVAVMFNFFWSLFFTWNNVSNLYIQNWGESVTDTEIATFEEEF